MVLASNTYGTWIGKHEVNINILNSTKEWEKHGGSPQYEINTYTLS